MPVMSGIEFVRIAKEKHPNLDMIMITTESGKEASLSSSEHGILGLISKPFTPANLSSQIYNILNSQGSCREMKLTRPLRIAYIDDNSTNLKLFKKYFEKKGHFVSTFLNEKGDQAYHLYKSIIDHIENRCPYDIVVFDYHMPKMTGVEILSRTFNVIKEYELKGFNWIYPMNIVFTSVTNYIKLDPNAEIAAIILNKGSQDLADSFEHILKFSINNDACNAKNTKYSIVSAIDNPY
jgi:CheY-like chemotaxis protein